MYTFWMTLLVAGSMRNGPRGPSNVVARMAAASAALSSVLPPVACSAATISRAVS